MRTMSIKEVERLTGINRANIRFYEKEGLITPVRNTDNNYRTYMDTDIQLLKKIKLLRALGIPVAEITRIKAHPESFSGILGQRLLDIEKEQQELVETKKVCRYLLEQKLGFSDLDEDIIDRQSVGLKDCIVLVMKTDLTHETMSGKQLTDMIGATLLYSLIATNLVFRVILLVWKPEASLLTSGVDFPFDLFILVYVIFSVIVTLSIAMTEKPVVHFIMLHLMILGQITAVTGIAAKQIFSVRMGMNEFLSLIDRLTLLACIHIIVIWIFSRFVKCYMRHLLCACIAPAFSTLVAWYILGKVLDSPCKISILFSIVAFYIALRWQVVNRNIDTCNRYYATTAVLNILAVPTLFVKGVGDGQSWRRGDKEYH